MQDLMPPVNTPDKLFHDGDPTQGIEGTIVTAEWLNNDQSAVRDVQAELINVLAAAAMTPDPTKQDQLVKAIQAIVGSGTADKANSADRLSTARKIANHPFDGTADISISASDVGALASDGKASSASTADKLSTARKIANHPFDGSTDISIAAGDVGAVSTDGGDYNKNFRFAKVGVIPNESNETSLFSERAGSGGMVSGSEFNWYGNKVRFGILRDSSTGVSAIAVMLNATTLFTISPNGTVTAGNALSANANVTAGGEVRATANLVAVNGGVFESNGNVRVYSSNNPPPNQSGSTTTGNYSAYYRHGNGQIFMQCIGGVASNSSSNPNVTVYLPAAFPNGILAIAGSFSGSGGSDRDSWWTASAASSSSFNLHTSNMNGTFSFVVTGY
ncbi:hypothetical protein ACJCHP_001712 [Enterobacter asburiae]